MAGSVNSFGRCALLLLFLLMLRWDSAPQADNGPVVLSQDPASNKYHSSHWLQNNFHARPNLSPPNSPPITEGESLLLGYKVIYKYWKIIFILIILSPFNNKTELKNSNWLESNQLGLDKSSWGVNLRTSTSKLNHSRVRVRPHTLKLLGHAASHCLCYHWQDRCCLCSCKKKFCRFYKPCLVEMVECFTRIYLATSSQSMNI